MELDNPIRLVSFGRHTRLGDVLEHAFEGLPFQTADVADLPEKGLEHHKVLFAVSADSLGENEEMRGFTARLLRGECRLEGSVCAMVADGEQGGAVHTDALRLLLAANGTGAGLLSLALLESGRDIRNLQKTPGKVRETPFERYCMLAKSLATRLFEYDPHPVERAKFHFCTALSEGTEQDWRSAFAHRVDHDLVFSETENADNTLLLAENRTGMPDERTLALLQRGKGRLGCLIASPETGSDFYALALLDQACARGRFSLAPEGMLLFNGMSAVEVLASKPALERANQAIKRMLR
ncbi:MAG: hypothetical protein LLF75_11510 [Eubacteriales bacterium]|nr:hypothetical protein [Eubacteriales bacterium]